jgi:hypothetical protein
MTGRIGINTGISAKAFAVTASDTLSNVYSYLYVGGAGNVYVETEGGDTVGYIGVPAGSYLWIRTRKVLSTNTTATFIIGHQ